MAALGGVATVRFTDAEIDARRLRDLPGVRTVQRHGPEVHVVGGRAGAGARGRPPGRRRAPPLDLHIDRPTLEDRFVALTEETSP